MFKVIKKRDFLISFRQNKKSMNPSPCKRVSRSNLQSLFWEVKARFFYLCLAFFFSLTVSYKNSEPLLYLFLLSADKPSSTDTSTPVEVVERTNIFKYSDHTVNQSDYENIISEKSDFPYIFPLEKSAENSGEKSDLLFTKLLELGKSKAFPIWEDETVKFSEKWNKDVYKKLVEEFSVDFIFTDVQEAFASHFLIVFLFSIMIIFPYLLYLVLSFFSASLFCHQSKKAIIDLLTFFVFWCFLTISIQKMIIPKIGSYLRSFDIDNTGFRVEASTKIYSYCVWAFEIYIIFSSFFIVVYLMIYLSVNRAIEITFFIKNQNRLRIILLLVSTFLAPPDLGNTLGICFICFLSLEICLYLLFIYKHLSKASANKSES